MSWWILLRNLRPALLRWWPLNSPSLAFRCWYSKHTHICANVQLTLVHLSATSLSEQSTFRSPMTPSDLHPLVHLLTHLSGGPRDLLGHLAEIAKLAEPPESSPPRSSHLQLQHLLRHARDLTQSNFSSSPKPDRIRHPHRIGMRHRIKTASACGTAPHPKTASASASHTASASRVATACPTAKPTPHQPPESQPHTP